ncbi:MAG: class I SAM-dependent methyltransferase [Acutalibacteraceae bacterium]|nr:class I SAM-dependent methyltransferase [Acutalibacteraceae bacterium]
MENINEVYEFYNNGAEISRLEHGLGIVEFCRSKEIISEYVKEQSTIYDIGGGIGMYSSWLAENGHNVTLIELAPNAVDYAISHQQKNAKYYAEVGDARRIDKPDESADVVLLMGPMYHLQNKEDRRKVLSEANRVLKKGGLLFVAGISKFSSTTWALSVYGNGCDFIDDDIYFNMLREELGSGKHIRPKEYPYIIANAYFHTAEGMRKEISESGFEIAGSHAVEGCIWITPKLDEKWQDESSRNRLLEIVRMTEHEESMIGMSPHFMVVASKK